MSESDYAAAVDRAQMEFIRANLAGVPVDGLNANYDAMVAAESGDTLQAALEAVMAGDIDGAIEIVEAMVDDDADDTTADDTMAEDEYVDVECCDAECDEACDEAPPPAYPDLAVDDGF